MGLKKCKDLLLMKSTRQEVFSGAISPAENEGNAAVTFRTIR